MAAATVAAVVILPVYLSPPSSIAGGFYQWVDENGVTHFADSPAGVPPRYRNQVSEKKYKKPPARSTVKELSAETGADFKPERAGAAKLRKYRVPYKAYGGQARRIIIPVTLNGEVTVPMALDTGAPGLNISPVVAEKLGLYEEDAGGLQIVTGGIGGVTTAVKAIIDTVQVGDVRDTFIPTTITNIDTPYFQGLVGMDFVSNYKIEIDTARRVLVFHELPPRDNMPGGHDEAWWRLNFHEFASYRNFWRDYVERMDKRASDTRFTGQTLSNINELKRTAQKQYEEAEKLFRKLDYYASQKAVPMSWRKY